MLLSAVVMANADTLSDLQSQQSQLEQQAQEYQAIMDEKKNEISEQEEYIEALTLRVNNVNEQIYLSREKISEYDAQISAKSEEIDRLNKEAEENMNILRKRLRAIYIAGDASALEIVLGAKDFSDFVDKLQLVESISDYDAKLIDDIESQLDGISVEVEELNVAKGELEAEHQVLASKQEELNELLEEHEQELAKLYSEYEDAEANLDSNEASQNEIEQQIQDYYKNQQQSNQTQGGSTGNTPSYGSGNYVWPAPGFYYLSSEYSEDRGSYYHGGIDIAGSGFMGATVVAADSGTVIDAYNGCTHNWGKYGSCGCGGGFGNYVWIDHGNGKATIYAHLSYHVVSVGSYVSAGQVIGYAGSTGYSTGPHLHFETRYNGVRYDPMSEF